jgi:preprotein translocase subunit SecB
MAEQDSTNGGNGSMQPTDEAQVTILAQYIKDFSVENPSAPQVFQWQVQPQLDVQFNINVEKASEDIHEVTLKMEVAARSENGVHFVIDLSYAGLFGIRNAPQDALPPFLLIEAPRLLFPFARQIISDATANAGFPPLLIDPIDFTQAYMAQVQAAQQQAGQQPAEGETTPPQEEPQPQ